MFAGTCLYCCICGNCVIVSSLVRLVCFGVCTIWTLRVWVVVGFDLRVCLLLGCGVVICLLMLSVYCLGLVVVGFASLGEFGCWCCLLCCPAFVLVLV